MKTKFKLKLYNKEIFIPKYEKEKIYFPLFKNKNLRNNQNYVLWKRILKKINFYWNNTFVWWSMIRIITKKWLNSYLNDHLKKFLSAIFIISILLFLSIIEWINFMTIILSMILSMISIWFLLTFIFDINKKNKKFLIIRDKNKYIIFKNEK